MEVAPKAPRPRVLFAMVLAIATSGLVYELGMASVASYVLGDTVSQFSLVIGVYLSAMGVGASLSRWVGQRLALTFIDVELSTALVGGLSAPGLLLAFGWLGAWELLLYTTVGAVGVLVGLELPLLIRVLEHRLELKELIAQALTFDYVGALLGSVAFSLVLVPELGLVKSSIVSGLLNAAIGLASTWALAGVPGVTAGQLAQARLRALAVIGILLFALLRADSLTRLADASAHPGNVVHAEQSAYQRIVLTELAGELRLFLNGHLQFSSRDEHRYHEALVHPALSLAARRQEVMIGGGGDGLAAREVLRWPDVQRVTVVDLDPAMTRLFARPGPGRLLNAGALADARVEIRNEDALLYLRAARRQFDVIVLDFPDPSNYAIGKLYSIEFYRLVEARLRSGGIVAVQATSPLFARSAFWCVARTLESAGLQALPYRVFLPSFGEWGFVLAARAPLTPPSHIPLAQLRYLHDWRLASLFVFPPDMSRVPVEVNRIDNQALVGYYVREWERWN